tara:strand:+ start:2084 stop:3241 length:1158 start_codon:yes stop_codon:yes gene_type:complete
MQLLGKNIQHYHWGDYEYIPSLQGRVSGADPEAELWMGAHPKSPSRVLDTNQGLDELIALNPDEALGEHAEDFNGELPYIMKILAIRSPLSLQVHPNDEQAAAGFTDESNLEKENGSYFSPRGKEEIVCAISDTDIKFGFRPMKDINDILALASNEEIRTLQELLSQRNSEQTLQEAIGKILAYQKPLVQSFVVDILSSDPKSTLLSDRELSYFKDLVETYPSDPGLIIFLLMNFLTLRPGESLYVPPGITHAYLHGNAVEITSNSDNVLRCGLTPKQIDHDQYLAVSSFSTSQPEIQIPIDKIHTYSSPTRFSLSRLEIEHSWEVTLNGPEILIATEGSFTITSGHGQSLHVDKGMPVWIPNSDEHYQISGTCLIFRCSTQNVD